MILIRRALGAIKSGLAEGTIKRLIKNASFLLVSDAIASALRLLSYAITARALLALSYLEY